MEVNFTPAFIGDPVPACPVIGLISSRCCTQGLSLARGDCGGPPPAMSAFACCLIQSACVEVAGSRVSALSHLSRACRRSPPASRAFASADRRSSSSECTSAWQWSHTSAAGGSSWEQRGQLRINSGVVVDTGRKNASALMVVSRRCRRRIGKRSVDLKRPAGCDPPCDPDPHEEDQQPHCPPPRAVFKLNERRSQPDERELTCNSPQFCQAHLRR